MEQKALKRGGFRQRGKCYGNRVVDAARWGSLVLVSCLWPSLARAAAPTPTIQPRVLAEYPHDSNAFTQGLVHFKGSFYESTGLRGRSSLRRVEPATGTVVRDVELQATEFGEGLARVGNRLVQLTWQEHVAHVYDLESFELASDHTYEGEGWGLCFDGHKLVMTDGSDQLFFRHPDSFELLGSQQVTDAGVSVTQLNELECAYGLVLANVWMTDSIVVIDPKTGHVLQRVDARGLLTDTEAGSADVLNGIAHDETTGHFYLTGKLWPKVFEVELDLPRTQQAPARGPSCAMCAVGRDTDGPPLAGGWFLVLVAIAARRFNPGGARFRAE